MYQSFDQLIEKKKPEKKMSKEKEKLLANAFEDIKSIVKKNDV
jgi:hypothetical protein